jgi:hypothetical protein
VLETMAFGGHHLIRSPHPQPLSPIEAERSFADGHFASGLDQIASVFTGSFYLLDRPSHFCELTANFYELAGLDDTANPHRPPPVGM